MRDRREALLKDEQERSCPYMLNHYIQLFSLSDQVKTEENLGTQKRFYDRTSKLGRPHKKNDTMGVKAVVPTEKPRTKERWS